MNDDQLRAVLQRSVGDLYADPAVADRAWRTAVQQDRRQRFAIVAGAAAAVVLVTVLIANPPSLDRSIPPAAPTPDLSAPITMTDETDRPEPTTESDDPLGIRGQGWGGVDVEELPWRQLGLPTRLVPDVAQALPLAADPIDKAIVAMQSDDASSTDWSQVTIYLLGDDGRWRSLAASELGFSGATVFEDYSLLGFTAMSPDGQKLAFKDVGSVGYVDLASGQVKRFDLPWREPLSPHWDAASKNLFTANRYSSTENTVQIDIESGAKRPAPMNFFGMTFADDGTAVEVTGQGYKKAPSELRTYDESGLISAVPLSIPVFNANALAVARDVALERYTVNEAGDIGRQGFTILDRSSGEPIAHLDIGTSWGTLLGWLNPETVLFMTSNWKAIDSYGTDVIAWNHRTGSFFRVSRVEPGWYAIFNNDALSSS